jgi:hypothetical protein
MRGRFTLRSFGEVVSEAFGLLEAPVLVSRLNIASGEQVAVVQQKPQTHAGSLGTCAGPPWSIIQD